jgi:hypothetical protein
VICGGPHPPKGDGLADFVIDASLIVKSFAEPNRARLPAYVARLDMDLHVPEVCDIEVLNALRSRREHERTSRSFAANQRMQPSSS